MPGREFAERVSSKHFSHRFAHWRSVALTALTHRVAPIEYSARTAHLASWSPFVITEIKAGEAFLDVVSFPVALEQLVVAV